MLTEPASTVPPGGKPDKPAAHDRWIRASERIPPSHMALLILLMMLRIVFVIAAGLPWMTSDARSWPMEDDSHQYVRYAGDLLDGSQEEPAVRMPLYPAFLALTWSRSQPWLLSLLLQQAMGLAIGVLCYLTAASCSRKAALPAGALVMLLPQHVLLSTRIMPDTMALLAVCASGYLWTRTLRNGSPGVFIACFAAIGAVLSLGAMSKQVLLYSPVVPAALLAVSPGRGFRVKAAALLAMLVVFAILPLGWRMYNRSAFGLDAYSTQDAFEPLARTAILAGVTDQQSVWSGEFTAGLDSLAMVDGRVDFGLRDSIYRARTRGMVLAEPVRVLLPHLTSWPRFFSLGYAHKILRSMRIEESGLPLAAWKGILAIIYLLMAAGVCLGLLDGRVRRRMRHLLLLLLGWFVFSALIYGPLATTRYGVTFYWAMALCSVTALAVHREARSSGSSVPEASGGAA